VVEMSVREGDSTGKSAFFRVLVDAGSEVLHPLPASASGWSRDQIRGMAVSGALARATERTADQMLPGMRPARWAVDLFRPARVRPTTVTTTVVRHGRRIGVIDAELSQEGRPVARSRALFARPSPTPAGRVWRPEHTLPAPPPDLRPTGDDPRLYYSRQQGWTTQADSHQNGSRKQVWHLPIPLVQEERPTPFQMIAGVADLTSLVVNWGTAGVQFINADIDLVLTRLPVSMEVGLSAIDRSEGDGIAVGTAVIFDREGRLGSASVVALANPVSGVDPANRRPDLTAFEALADGGQDLEARVPVR
jgi:hypothetical protein